MIVKKRKRNIYNIILNKNLSLRESKGILRESERKHHLLIEGSRDIIYSLSADSVFTFVSSAWPELLGHPVSEVVAQPFHQFIHPDDLTGFIDFIEKSKQREQLEEGTEYRIQHAQGHWCWHNSRIIALKDNLGTLIGFEGTSRDITERKRAELLLKQTHQNYETFFNTIDDLLFVLDDKGNIIHVNSTVIDRLGFNMEELIGQSV